MLGICSKNKLKKIVIAVVICLFSLLLIYIVYNHISQFVIRTENYENEDYTLELRFLHDGDVDFLVTSKKNNSAYKYPAHFVDENKAIFDGSKGFPESGVYYELIFSDDTIELYNNGKLVSSFSKEVDG
ncbi:MAG: hypothetical protein IJS45_09985 [Clostridia bacterium]|nr:hypothetical protein [Clostridia bacterium]